MRIDTAREIAREWIQTEGTQLPGFCGAFLAGSTNDMAPDDELDPTSDLDVMVVVDTSNGSTKPGKFLFHGVLLEVSVLETREVLEEEAVLSHYHLGRVVATARILADPDGRLTQLHEAVAARFVERIWIEARVRQAAETVTLRLDSIPEHTSLAERIMAWLFAAGGLPHVLLVAGLRNPTVRKRYVAARDMLEQRGMNDHIVATFLDILDPRRLQPERIRVHLDNVAAVFDATTAINRSSVFFASDLTADARPLSIDGSRNLIDAGMHREAIFWIVATFCRCQIVWHVNAPPGRQKDWDPMFLALLRDLSIRDDRDLNERCEAVRELMPETIRIAQTLTETSTVREVG